MMPLILAKSCDLTLGLGFYIRGVSSWWQLLMFKFVSRDATRDVCGGVELGQLKRKRKGLVWKANYEDKHSMNIDTLIANATCRRGFYTGRGKVNSTKGENRSHLDNSNVFMIKTQHVRKEFRTPELQRQTLISLRVRHVSIILLVLGHQSQRERSRWTLDLTQATLSALEILR